MSEGILLELQFFGRAFVWGILMMLLYEGLHLLRLLFRHGTLLLAVEDVAYWLTCAVLIFRLLYLENSGAIRGFAIAAVVLGMVLYLQFVKLLKKLQNKLHKSVKRRIISVSSFKERKR